MVQPEDWLVPMRDYDLHMRMVGYLHNEYPKVNITLHAGELTFGQVPPEENSAATSRAPIGHPPTHNASGTERT